MSEVLTQSPVENNNGDNFDEAFFAQQDAIEQLAKNPNVNYDSAGDSEGGDTEAVQDPKGNELRASNSFAGDSISATYHVEGGADNGGKTYEFRNDVYGKPETTVKTSEKVTTIQSSKLAGKVIRMATQSIDRNTK